MPGEPNRTAETLSSTQSRATRRCTAAHVGVVSRTKRAATERSVPVRFQMFGMFHGSSPRSADTTSNVWMSSIERNVSAWDVKPGTQTVMMKLRSFPTTGLPSVEIEMPFEMPSGGFDNSKYPTNPAVAMSNAARRARWDRRRCISNGRAVVRYLAIRSPFAGMQTSHSAYSESQHRSSLVGTLPPGSPLGHPEANEPRSGGE